MVADGECGAGAHEGEDENEVMGSARGRCEGFHFWGDGFELHCVGNWEVYEVLWIGARGLYRIAWAFWGIGLGYMYRIGQLLGWIL